jgi:hypothetical protein
MTAPTVDLVPASVAAAPSRHRAAAPASLPTYRVNLMRLGYGLMAFGIAATKWPVLPGAASLPVYEGVVAAMLTAMSLLAFLGLRYPVKLLPVLIFESAWKLIWLAVVAVPHLVAGDMSADMGRMLFNVSLVVVILAVTPWDYVWRTYVRATGDPWRSPTSTETLA